MESQYWNDEVQQSAWLLDYDRRCMLDCADTFQNLAAVMGEMNWELEQEKRRTIGRAASAQTGDGEPETICGAYASDGGNAAVGSGYVRSADPAGRSAGKQIVRALAGEGIVVEDIYLLRGKRTGCRSRYLSA